MNVRARRSVGYVLLTCAFVALGGYLVFSKHKTFRIEGETPVAIQEFGDGATVSHAFLMNDDRLHAVSVRIAAGEPLSLRVACKLLRLYDRSSGAENDSSRYTEIYRWTQTVSVGAGEHWRRFDFPVLADSNDEWYAFEIRLLEALPSSGDPDQGRRPVVSLMASVDNPIRGGKLWIDLVRQPGALFIRADGATLYERFLLRVEPGLPVVLRNRAVQAALALVYLWAFVTLAYAMLFGRTDDIDRRAFHPWPASDGANCWSSAVALSQVVILSATLALFFVVPLNPASSLPLLPELILFGTLCMITGVSFPTVPDQEGWSRPLRRDEKLFLALLATCFGYTTFWAIQGGFGLHSGSDPCGGVAPSAIVRLECRLQASFNQSYAWRNVSQLTLVVCISVVTALMTRTIPGFWRKALTAIVLVGLAHASIGFVALWSYTPQIVPKWIMVNSYELDRFTLLIPHPGYVWPQLAPAFAISVWQANYGTTRIHRLIGLVAALALAAAICATRQRGGLLLVGTMAMISSSATIFSAARQSAGRESLYATVRLAICALICVSLFYPFFVSRSVWGTRFVDTYRLRIWKGAIDGVMKEHPLFGFGYARWGEFTRVALGTPAESVLDSAHSLWVRVLFELGVTGLVLVVGCVVCALVIAVRNAAQLNGGPFLVLCASLAFLICATFEEVDFVRPVFVTHALVAAVCCGLPFRGSFERVGRVRA